MTIYTQQETGMWTMRYDFMLLMDRVWGVNIKANHQCPVLLVDSRFWCAISVLLMDEVFLTPLSRDSSFQKSQSNKPATHNLIFELSG